MTIKEVENRTGMTRANIRFYETEGLLHPARGENGYRDYSEEDVRLLRKIKLLRLVDMPLEEIKALQSGKGSFSEVLSRRISALERERDAVDASCRLCRAMREEGACFETLDTERWFAFLDSPQTTPAWWMERDSVPKVKAPWRRFFARMADQLFYGILWYALVGLVFRANPTGNAANLLRDLCVIVMNLFLEPLLLHWLGTTPGKWLFGLSVTAEDGSRLTYSDALDRTWWVLYRGFGLFIPIYGLYRLWKSYSACQENEELDWEDASVLAQKDESNLRWAAFVGAYAVGIGLSVMLALLSAAPLHRGTLTVAEVSENYNHMAGYYDLAARELKADGTWESGVLFAPTEIEWQLEDGAVTGLSFEVELSESSYGMPMQEEIITLILSFVPAQRDYGLLQARDRLIRPAIGSAAEGFSFTEAGVSVVCEVSHSGYQVYEDVLFAEEEDCSYRLRFSMELTE